jgi:hypothetical protein
LGCTPSKSVSSGRKKMLKNQDASYDYQKPTPKRRGTFHIKKKPFNSSISSSSR